jgi:hypothetical protein
MLKNRPKEDRQTPLTLAYVLSPHPRELKPSILLLNAHQ